MTAAAGRRRYWGGFADYQSMVDAFMDAGWDYEKREKKSVELPDGFPADDQVLFAAYGTEEAYSGAAFVVYRDSAGQLQSVGGSHCSCYGLEGQWSPGATTAAGLKTESRLHDDNERYSDYDVETRAGYRALVALLEAAP